METVEQPAGGYSVLNMCTTEGCGRLRQYNVGFIWSCCCKECYATDGREHCYSCDERHANMQQAMATASDDFRVAVQSTLTQNRIARPAPKWQTQEARRVVWKPVCSVVVIVKLIASASTFPTCVEKNGRAFIDVSALCVDSMIQFKLYRKARTIARSIRGVTLGWMRR